MIAWVHIVSPKLRSLYGQWTACRVDQTLPNIVAYNDFAIRNSFSDEMTVTAIISAMASSPTIRTFGSGLVDLFQDCRRGQLLREISSPFVRAALRFPIENVIRSRQMDAVRLSKPGQIQAAPEKLIGPSNAKSGFTASQVMGAMLQSIPMELLFLPFGDANGAVRLIYVAVDADTKNIEAAT
jgi:hypothetical protein